MAGTTPLQGLPYPSTTDAALGPAAIQALGVAVESKLPQYYASAAARTAAFTAAGISPAAQMLSYRADAPGTNKWEYYNATAAAWRVYGAYRDVQVLSVAAAAVTFSAIPSYLRELTVRATTRSDWTGGVYSGLNARINGDTSGLYRIFNRFAGLTATYDTNPGTVSTSMTVSFTPAASAWANVYGSMVLNILGWDAAHSGCLNLQAHGGFFDGAGNGLQNQFIGSYAGAGPYTSFSIYPAAGNLVAGCQFSVEGRE